MSWQKRLPLLLLGGLLGVFAWRGALQQDDNTNNNNNKPSLFRRLSQDVDDDTSPSFDLSTTFPALDDIQEMASLSSLVYAFRFVADDDNVCPNINNPHSSYYTKGGDPNVDYESIVMEMKHLHCHWYHHNHKTGTQVMIVSSITKSYLAVVFAGTDDLKTSLTDANICMKPYGDAPNSSHSTLMPKSAGDVVIHSGFNNAVFEDALFDQIMKRVDPLKHKFRRLFTTGHSLGAADSVITAVGMGLHYNKHHKNKKDDIPITCINFGCPYIGKSEWRDYVHHAHNSVSNVGIWRLVLGWDLVPRLPEFMDHVGHTIQLDWNNGHEATANAYYQHYGNNTLGYASVPRGWQAMPFIFIPGALYAHSIVHYVKFLTEWSSNTNNSSNFLVDDFVRIDNDDDDSTSSSSNDGDDDLFHSNDDIFHRNDDLFPSNANEIMM